MTASNKWSWLSLILVCGVLVYVLAPVLTPFTTVAILAYLGAPLVDRLFGFLGSCLLYQLQQ